MNKEKDPYLIPGQPCEISGEGGKFLRYFLDWWYGDNEHKLDSPMPRFYVDYHLNKKTHIGIDIYYDYRPIGTEWDFAPDWAEYIVVEKRGRVYYYKDKPKINGNNQYWETTKGSQSFVLGGGICPDKSRYENGAWKNSLIARPDWTRV